MNNSSFKYKYLKYKSKYLDLMNMKGGANAFSNGKNFNILYFINDEQTVKAVSERRATLFNDASITYDRPDEDLRLHITLLNFQINLNNSMIESAVKDKSFRDEIRRLFNKYLDGEILTHTRNGYKTLSGFYGKEYQLVNPQKITEFRMAVYNYISFWTADPWTQRKGSSSDFKPTKIEKKNGFVYLSYHGEETIAIPEYSWGRGNWLPHISMFQYRNDRYRLLSLYHQNRTLYDSIKPDIDSGNSKTIKDKLNGNIGSNQQRILSTMPSHLRFGLDGRTPRERVMPFGNIQLDKSEKLVISMARNNPAQNWEV